MVDQQFDILVALSISTMFPTEISSDQIRPTIIEINWCAYDLKRQMVIDEVQHYVKPLDFNSVLPEETILRTNVGSEQLFSALSLFEVIQKFNDFLYLTFVRNNLSFCLVTFGDELLCSILPAEAKEAKIKLAYHFHQYFDIKDEFNKFSSNNGIVTLKDMLNYLGLKEVPAETVCQNNCKTLVRIINMLTRSNHNFINPKVVNSQIKEKEIKQVNIVQYTIPTNAPKISSEKKKYSNYVKSKSPEVYKTPFFKYYLRLRGLPYNSKPNEIKQFFRGIQVWEDDIQFFYQDGKLNGECFVRIHSDSDYKEALSFNLSLMGSRNIEIFESSNVEFEKAKMSQPQNLYPSLNISPLNGIIKMQNLSYSCTEDDISFFFRDFKIVAIKRGYNGGLINDEAFIVFESVDEAEKAMKLNMEKIGTKSIELSLSNSFALSSYLSTNFIPSLPNSSLSLNIHPTLSSIPPCPSIPAPNSVHPTVSTLHYLNAFLNPPASFKNCLMVCGLGFGTTKEMIIEFFKDFKISDKDLFFVENQNGKFSGCVVVNFEEESEMVRALRWGNLKKIGNKEVELVEVKGKKDKK